MTSASIISPSNHASSRAFDWRGAEAHQLRAGKVAWSAAGFRDVQEAIDAVRELRAERSQERTAR
jgi:hypothetical protein